jgi:uncharacterized protein (TIGR01244 family)
MKRLDDKVQVSGQVRPEEVAGLGVAMLINNRPDDEEPGQPTSAEVEAAARAAGVEYRHIPAVVGAMSLPQIAQMQDALAAADGPVHAFCKSGTRSTFLWALARAKMGDDAEELVAKAAAAGYDLTPIRAYLAP